jgi:hypothetical protein
LDFASKHAMVIIYMMHAVLFLCLGLSASSQAHEGHAHGSSASAGQPPPGHTAEIQALYEQNVKPIFERKCASCHSREVPPPWYAAIPGVGWLIDHDRSEAVEHLEISKGFPFGGHGSVVENFKEIEEVVEDGSMPIFLYRLMHPSSRLTAEEKDTILAWVKAGRDLSRDGAR